MKNSILSAIFGAAVIGAVPAHATTSGFDFTQCATSSNYYANAQTEAGTCDGQYSNSSNQFSQTVTGVGTVTAYGYATTTDSGVAGTAISDANSNAEVGQYGGYGLGVCSAGEDSANGGYSAGNGCNSPYHQVNNAGEYEFILFTFSTAVNLNTITLANFGGGSLSDMDISYWANVGSSLTAIPAGATNVLCGSGQNGAGTCPTGEGTGSGIGGSANSLTDTVNLTDVTTLLIGAYTASSDAGDTFFKIQGLGGVKDYTATPEPATFGLIGLSLVGLGLFRWKRRIN